MAKQPPKNPVLTERQKRFADEYLICLNAAEAVRRAGYNCKYPDRYGSQLMHTPHVLAYIEQRKQRLREATEVTQEWVVQKLVELINTEVYDFMKISDGGHLEFKTFEDVPREKRPMLKRIKEQMGKIDSVEIEVLDKIPALQMLAKHLGMLDKGTTLSLPDGAQINITLIPAEDNAGGSGDDKR